jgi:hypothetical protein
MSAGTYNFTIEQGTTVNFELQYTDDNNVPIDLTNHSGKLQIKSNFANDKPVTYATLSSSLLPDGTGLDLNGMNGNMPLTSGSIGIYISAATSSLFTFAKARYDLELYTGTTVTRILEGVITLSKEVTTDK